MKEYIYKFILFFLFLTIYLLYRQLKNIKYLVNNNDVNIQQIKKWILELDELELHSNNNEKINNNDDKN